MDKIIWILIAVGLGILAVVFWLRNRKLKKDVYDFEEKLEKYLDDMIAGREIIAEEKTEESLWGKISVRLERLYQIGRKKETENMEEKKKLKELISDISHQTKTPIANLKIYLELLEDENTEEAKRKEFLKKMEGQTDKLDFLIQSMVEMSRLETGIIKINQKQKRIYDTLAEAVSAVVPKAEKKGIEIHVKCEEDLLVSHDRKWTGEAIYNLLDNGVKYTPAGGKIEIEAEAYEFFTKISIRDNGKGIARERQAEIFKRFYREPEVHDTEGVGVGLYLARQIISMQKGYIEVQSELGQGAEFRIFLPNQESKEERE